MLVQWDRVLDLTDEMVDKWLPETEPGGALMCDSTSRPSDSKEPRSEHEFSSTNEDLDASDISSDSESDISDVESGLASLSSDDETNETGGEAVEELYLKDMRHQKMKTRKEKRSRPTGENLFSSRKRSSNHLVQDHDEEDDFSPAQSLHEKQSLMKAETSLSLTPARLDRTGGVLMTKFGKRLRQRMPSLSPLSSSLSSSLSTFSSLSSSLSLSSLSFWSSQLKQSLVESAWFSRVDEILLQNKLLQLFAGVMRPAEHFFNTSWQLFTSVAVTSNASLPPPLVSSCHFDSNPASEPSTFNNSCSNTGDDSTNWPVEQKAVAVPSQQLHISVHNEYSPLSSVSITSTASLSVTIVPRRTSFETSSSSNALPAIAEQATPTPVATLSSPSVSIDSSLSSLTSSATTSTSAKWSSSHPLPLSVLSPNGNSELPASPHSASYEPVLQDFVSQLRSTMGVSWDDRLAQPASHFFHTALSLKPKCA